MNDLLDQIQQGEGQYREFKVSFQKEVIETVVAFANAKGGKVFIGVDDIANIIGVSSILKAYNIISTLLSKILSRILLLKLTLNALHLLNIKVSAEK